ncbi:MAG: protease HtpX [Simkaniaceae bacterium]|nr:protease HtpX [Simkaniaceae bacterium]
MRPFAFLKRVTLFLVVNLLVVLTLSLLLSLLGVRSFIGAYGLDLPSLALFCLIWGMGGALISLLISRKMAKWLMRIRIIDPTRRAQHTGREEVDLLATVERLSRSAGLSHTPEVGIFDSPDMNAFATGPSQKRSLVAVSTGLLRGMGTDEREAVLGHEITHIANGDMVTMTLIQGIVNAFVMFLSRILAYAISVAGRGDNRRSSFFTFYLLTFVFEIFFMLLGSLVVSAFSRRREFRADRGGATLSGKDNMIAALKCLKKVTDTKGAGTMAFGGAKSLNALMISRPGRPDLLRLFATHPPLEKRIRRLEETPLPHSSR